MVTSTLKRKHSFGDPSDKENSPMHVHRKAKKGKGKLKESQSETIIKMLQEEAHQRAQFEAKMAQLVARCLQELRAIRQGIESLASE
jgi:hypothetical protein